MDLISRKIGGQVEGIIRAAALAMDTSVVVTTPVDTGRARGNYVTSIGVPSGEVFDVSGAGAATTSLSQGRSVISRWKLAMPAIFITNNLPYIMKLDTGSSAQAPNGMSRAALAVGQLVVKKGRLLGRKL